MSKRRSRLFVFYVGAAVTGAILPYTILLPWLAAHGIDIPLFVGGLFVTGPAAIFAIDALLSAAIFIVFIIAEGRRLGMRRLWLPSLLIFLFGLCCGMPTFLAIREARLGEAA